MKYFSSLRRASRYIVLGLSLAIVSTIGIFIFAPVAKASGGTVTGRFVVGGVPVGASQVSATLYRQLTVSGAAGFTYSAADGTFTFTNIPAASDYYMIITISSPSLGALGKTVSNIIVTDSQSTALGDISLPATTKTISGTVKRADGSALTNARIAAYSYVNGTSLNTYAITNAAGAYSVRVSGGAWTISPVQSKEPYVYGENADFYWEDSIYKFFNFADDTTVESRTANFSVLTTTATATGRIVSPTGVGLGSISLSISNFNVTTNYNGYFTVHATAGKRIVKANAYSATQYYIPAWEVNLPAGEIKDLGTITVSERKAHITGTVTDENGAPIYHAQINGRMRTELEEMSVNTYTNAAGAYDLLVSPGTWSVFSTMYTNPPYVDISADDNPDVVIGGETETQQANFQKARSDITIQVNIVDADGQVVTGFSGSVGDTNANIGGTITNGRATLYASSRKVSRLTLKTIAGNDSSYTPNSTVSLTVAANQTYTVNIPVTQNTVTLTGNIVDQNGALLTDVYASVEVANGDTWLRTVSSNGHYSISFTPGTWSIHLQSNSTDYLAPSSTSGTFTAGTSSLNFTLTKTSAVVTGTLTGPSGENVPSAMIAFYADSTSSNPVPGYVYTYVTDSRFTAKLIGGIRYRVNVGPLHGSSFLQPDDIFIDVPATGTMSLKLKYTKSDGYISGTITLPDGTKAKNSFISAFSDSGQHVSDYATKGTYKLAVTKNDRWHLRASGSSGGVYYQSEEIIVDTPSNNNFTVTKNFQLAPASYSLPAATSITFSSAEAKTITLDNGARVVIPANALSETQKTVTVTITPTTQLPSTRDDRLIEGYGYSITAVDSDGNKITTLNSPVTITFPVSSSQLNKYGLTVSSIGISYYNESTGSWQKLPSASTVSSSSVSKKSPSLTAIVDHFSDFALTTKSAMTQKKTVVISGERSPYVTILTSSGKVSSGAPFAPYGKTFNGGVRAISYDMNQDGTNEIVTVPAISGTPTLKALTSKGKLIDDQRLPSAAGKQGLVLAIGDVTGDGLPDAVIASAGINSTIWVYSLTGKVWKLQQTIRAFPVSSKVAMSLAVGDVTGDGQADIVAVGSSSKKLTVRTFSKGLKVGQFTPKGWTVARPELVDVNNSGVKDILLVPAKGAKVAAYSISGKSLAKFTLASSAASNIRLTAGDSDNNGRAELIVSAQAGDGKVRVYTNQGKLKKTITAFSASDSGVVTTVGDINGDGNADLVATPGNGTSGSVKAWRISNMKSLWTGAANATIIRGISLSLGSQ